MWGLCNGDGSRCTIFLTEYIMEITGLKKEEIEDIKASASYFDWLYIS